MTRRRSLLTVTVVGLGQLVGAGAGLLVGCAPLAPLPGSARPAAPREPSLADLAPAPSEALLVVDVAWLRGSPWSKPVFAWARERQRTASGKQGLRGFDEIDDVDRWVFAKIPSGAPSAAVAETLELAEGRFQRAVLEQTFRRRHPGGSWRGPAGSEVLSDEERAIALLGKQRVALGPAPAVARAAEVARGQTPAATTEPWLAAARAALEDEAGPRSRSVAMELCLRVTEAIGVELGGWLGRPPRIEQLAARLSLAADARLVLVAVTSDRDEARFLADRLGQALGQLSRRRSVRALGLGPAVSRATATARGARLVLELAVREGEREVVAGRLSELAAILGRPPDAEGGAPPPPEPPASPP
jgi:hypothetical protein